VIERVTVRRGAYHDSVTLMLASQDAGALAGIDAASAINGTPLNVELVAGQGFDLSAEGELGPSDLVIAVRAVDEAALGAALAAVEERLQQAAPSDPARGIEASRSLAAAARRRPTLSLAVVSVPGQHAAYECASALEAGLHVFCFSDGPSIDDELALKRRALELDRLMMGPDCGTAILDGAALGFANALRDGPVGVVGASGTGIQALTTMLDSADVGISHAIGVGGRDLDSHIGGLMTIRGIELLAGDPDTEAIVVISKKPDEEVAARVAAAAEASAKPYVLAFPGLAPESRATLGAEASLEDAAARAAAAVGRELLRATEQLGGAPTPGAIRGLFCGGTLRDEAAEILAAAPADVELVDFGDDSYTRGRPHPMIDPSLRNARLERELARAEVGVVLVDVLLGRASHPDPAAALVPLIAESLERRSTAPTVLVSLCGTDRDPQGLASQAERLRTAGAVVTRSNAHAARLALAAAGVEVSV
jgi:FdrA protein